MARFFKKVYLRFGLRTTFFFVSSIRRHRSVESMASTIDLHVTSPDETFVLQVRRVRKPTATTTCENDKFARYTQML